MAARALVVAASPNATAANRSLFTLAPRVITVDKNAAYSFAKIAARPAAGVDNYRYVMLLPTPPAAVPRPETKAADERKPGKDRTRRRDAPR